MRLLKPLLTAVTFAFLGTIFILMAIVAFIGLILSPLVRQNRDYEPF
jgi:hypothetical protein